MIRGGCTPIRTSHTTHPKMTIKPVIPSPSLRLGSKLLTVATNSRRVMSTIPPQATPQAPSEPNVVSPPTKEESTPPLLVVKSDSSLYYFRVGVMSTATFGGLVIGGPLGAMCGFAVSGLILEASKS